MNREKGLILVVGALLAGCIPSLHPLYTKNEVVYDSRLIGVWKDSNSADTWEFRAAGEPNSYTMIYTDQKKKTGSFNVHLVKLDKMLFLDVFPSDSNLPYNDFYKLHLYPVHTFAKIKQIEPTLQMSFMDVDKFTKRLEKDPTLLKHEVIEIRAEGRPEVVITASTKELQDFMRKHAGDEGIFGESSNMKRTMPADSNTPKK
jgi:hypothetical protein